VGKGNKNLQEGYEKHEARNPKYETNSKVQNGNVQKKR